MRHDVYAEYFRWLCDLVGGVKCSKTISYKNLLWYLYNTEFIFSISRDANRASDGIQLRYRFDERESIQGPCNVLEMMVALALRCEETIMDNTAYGNRTAQWFWTMVNSLGLSHMTDSRYDEPYVAEVIDIFLNREYEPNGKGGLVTIRNCDRDLRDVEIWIQMLWYLNTIT